MITELDRGQAEYYKNFPELIKSIDPWETVKSCAACGGELDDEMPCMHGTANGRNEKVPNSSFCSFAPTKVTCPHCKILPPVITLYKDTRNVFTASPIKFKLNRRRKVWIIKATWWERLRGLKDKYFYEYAEEKDGGGQREYCAKSK